MGEDVEDVVIGGVDHGQSVDAVVDEAPDGVVERRVRSDGHEQLGVVLEHAAPRLQLVLLQFVDVHRRRLVVALQDLDEVGDGQHADKLLLLAVP